MPVVPWCGGCTVVGFANVDSTFLDASDLAPGPGSALSRRAAAVLAPRAVLVAYEPPSLVPGLAGPALVHVARRSGDLCADFLDDGPAFDELRRLIATVPPPWRLWAQTYTPTMDLLSFELERHGFDRSPLPVCSGVTVAFRNTKVGGDELLRGAAGDRYPTTWVYGSVQELLGRRLGATAVVVKPNRAMGGRGVVMVDGVRTLDAAALEAQSERSEPAPKLGIPKPPGKTGEAVVLQEVVGEVSTNRSPSADYWVDADGTTAMVAFAEQVLDGQRYAGSRSWAPDDDGPPAIASAIGTDVGRELHREGYRGLFNLDFVVTSEAEVAVLEINLRQSAPLDQTITMERRFGTGWQRIMAFEAREGAVDLHGDDVLRYELDEGDVALTLAMRARGLR